MSSYQCQECAATSPKWQGKCSDCGSWGSLVEQQQPVSVGGSTSKSLEMVNLDQARKSAGKHKRIKTGITDVDHVFGGGVVPGSLTVVTGEPGIGKSTLLLQVAAHIAENKGKVLYVSGEESAEQIALRAQRLRVSSDELMLAAGRSAESVAEEIAAGGHNLVIIDSVQTLAVSRLVSAPGTVSQIVASLNLVSQAAKSSGCAVILVGQVTKSGAMAGPKVLEHLVDVVISFNGEVNSELKVLSAVKNRFGSIDEAAIMTMGELGLKPILNTSDAILSQKSGNDGSVLLMTIVGNRPIVVEIQALVNRTSFGHPKRTASGFDANRLHILLAILSNRTSVDLSEHDVYVNVVGGLKLDDRAADLAICMAVASSLKKVSIGADAVVFGEVGLGGEIRTNAKFAERRVQEALKQGFKTVIAPSGVSPKAKGYGLLRSALNDNVKMKVTNENKKNSKSKP